MKRVLIVPSWYPTAERPYVGVFFQEQALLARQDFDVRVLIVDPWMVGRRKAATWLKLCLTGPKITAVERGILDEAPQVYHFQAEMAARGNNRCPLANAKLASLVAGEIEADHWQPDLIHGQGANSGGILARELALTWEVPYVITEHQHILFDYFTHQQWQDAKGVYSNALRVAAVSQFERQMMLMQGVDTPVCVTGNLIDDAAFRPAPAPPGNNRKILFVGFTSRLKDYDTFFHALEHLKTMTHLSFEATMVSPAFQPGDEEKILLEIRKRSLVKDVQILASAGRAEIIRLIQKSSVFVSTSIAETFGVAVGEALMCGCPVVATRSGGVDDFVEDGRNGYLVPIGDAVQVGHRILDVFNGALPLSVDEIRGTVLGKYGRSAFQAKQRALYSLMGTE